MHRHATAAPTPRHRAQVFKAVDAGMTVSAACATFRVSRRFSYHWLQRWRESGQAGLVDHSSRPRHSPQRLPGAREMETVALRRRIG